MTYCRCLPAYDGLWRSCGARRRGNHGRATVEALLARWEAQEPSLSGTPYDQAALSVAADNETALRLYRSLGFVETGELSDAEVVLRRSTAHGS